MYFNGYGSMQPFIPYPAAPVYPYNYSGEETLRQPPQLERRIAELEQVNRRQNAELTRQNEEIGRINREIRRINRENNRQNDEIDRLNRQIVRLSNQLQNRL